MESSTVDTEYKRMSIILKIFVIYAGPPSHNICKWPKNQGRRSNSRAGGQKFGEGHLC